MTKKQRERWDKFRALIRLSGFLEGYCGIPYTPFSRHKAAGTNKSNGPADFTPEEWTKINKGLERLLNEFKNGF